MGLEIAFWTLAITSVIGALGVVLLRDIFRAALLLILCFLTVAGLFVIDHLNTSGSKPSVQINQDILIG